MTQHITPFLWFNDNAQQAVNFYIKIFPNSKITQENRYNEDMARAAGQKKGSLMTIGFKLNGVDFAAINGGPVFKFSQATSFVVHCKNQKEVDHYWKKLSAGGQKQPCGWVIDRFGVAWQITPDILLDMMNSKNAKKSAAAAGAMLQMTKIDIAKLKAAYDAA